MATKKKALAVKPVKKSVKKTDKKTIPSASTDTLLKQLDAAVAQESKT